LLVAALHSILPAKPGFSRPAPRHAAQTLAQWVPPERPLAYRWLRSKPDPDSHAGLSREEERFSLYPLPVGRSAPRRSAVRVPLECEAGLLLLRRPRSPGSGYPE